MTEQHFTLPQFSLHTLYVELTCSDLWWISAALQLLKINSHVAVLTVFQASGIKQQDHLGDFIILLYFSTLQNTSQYFLICTAAYITCVASYKC